MQGEQERYRGDSTKIPQGVEFHYVENINQVWDFALTDEIVANPLDLTIKDDIKQED